MMSSVLLCSVSEAGYCMIAYESHKTKCWTTFHTLLKEIKAMYVSSYKLLSKPVDEIDLHFDISDSSGKWMYFFHSEITITFLIAQTFCFITHIMPLTLTHDLYLSIFSVSKQCRNGKAFSSQYYTGRYSTFCAALQYTWTRRQLTLLQNLFNPHPLVFVFVSAFLSWIFTFARISRSPRTGPPPESRQYSNLSPVDIIFSPPCF